MNILINCYNRTANFCYALHKSLPKSNVRITCFVSQMSTSAGWDGVLDGIINEEECDLPDNERGYPGNCGSATIGITYLLSYLVISFLIVINMYIAVILENYSQVT